MTNLFIDGQAGTTGLQILDRLKDRDEFEIMHLADKHRKDIKARAEMLNDADVCILCLPEEASRESVNLIESEKTRVIDASIAYRTNPDWVYGFPEYKDGQREIIASSKRVTNPGCYACASISIIYPLIAADILPRNFPITINAVSGYSGGGRSLIAGFEDKDASNYTDSKFFLYSLELSHKHTPEIQTWCGLDHAPLFVPSVARFSQGMLVSVPLQLRQLEGNFSGDDFHSALQNHYASCPFINVRHKGEIAGLEKLDPEDVNDSNMLNIYVLTNDESHQVVICAQLDNLGKGASGQAVQNLNLMLGLEETAGLL